MGTGAAQLAQANELVQAVQYQAEQEQAEEREQERLAAIAAYINPYDDPYGAEARRLELVDAAVEKRVAPYVQWFAQQAAQQVEAPTTPKRIG